MPQEKKVLITPEFYRGLQDWYIEVIECPKCNHSNVAGSNYCNGCGVPFKLTTEVARRAGIIK